MVLNDIPQDSVLIKVRGARSDADILAHRYLNVVDVLAIPQRLKDTVRESEYEDVLNRLLSKVVVDSVDLLLREALTDDFVQLTS